MDETLKKIVIITSVIMEWDKVDHVRDTINFVFIQSLIGKKTIFIRKVYPLEIYRTLKPIFHQVLIYKCSKW